MVGGDKSTKSAPVCVALRCQLPRSWRALSPNGCRGSRPFIAQPIDTAVNQQRTEITTTCDLGVLVFTRKTSNGASAELLARALLFNSFDDPKVAWKKSSCGVIVLLARYVVWPSIVIWAHDNSRATNGLPDDRHTPFISGQMKVKQQGLFVCPFVRQ